jgi:ribosomal protein S18 acetylase RimI-like enzyme
MTKIHLKLNNLLDSEIKQVAELHVNYLNKGFLSQLDSGFIFYLYKAMSKSTIADLIIAKKQEEVVGFITGSSSLIPIYSYIIKHYLIQVLFNITPHLFNISKVKKIIEIISYSNNEKSEKHFPKTELLSLVVKEKSRRTGVAKVLFDELTSQFKKKGQSDFKIMVGEELKGAQRFYERMGAKKIGGIEGHQGKGSIIYGMSIKLKSLQNE